MRGAHGVYTNRYRLIMMIVIGSMGASIENCFLFARLCHSQSQWPSHLHRNEHDKMGHRQKHSSTKYNVCFGSKLRT